MNDDNRIDDRFACPSCGERDIDNLVWQDDEYVRCDTCGRVYKPSDTEPPQPAA